jgi:hypothetical protein
MNLQEIVINGGATVSDDACLFPATIIGVNDRKNNFYIQLDHVKKLSEKEDDYTFERNPGSLVLTVVWNKNKSMWHTYKSHYAVQPGTRYYYMYPGYLTNRCISIV